MIARVRPMTAGRTYPRRGSASWTAAIDRAPEPDKPAPEHGGIDYPYRDADGTLHYTVTRSPKKRFTITDPQGRTLPDPIPRTLAVLYRLPELAATPPGSTVLVVEGEKDVDTLTRAGFVATTGPCGTHMGWQASYTPWLADRHVVILPDADGPGRAHAKAVARGLTGVASSVVTVELHQRGPWDVTDWLGWDVKNTGSKLADKIAVARLATVGITRKVPAGRDRTRLILGADLPPTHRHVLTARHLLAELDEQDGLTARRLAEVTGLHRVTVQDALTALRHRGVLDGYRIDWPILALTQHGAATPR